MTTTIEVFADVRCPFTHVGLRRLVARRCELGRDDPRLRIRAWPLELVNGAPLDAGLVLQEAAALRSQVSPDLFTGLTASTFGSTSLPALALAGAAYRVSIATGEAVSLALRDTIFEEGDDVSSPDVLDGIAARHGVPAVTDDDREQVMRDWREGQQRGVTGSPHFLVGDRGYFCPSLDIRHDGGELDVRLDEPALEEFLAAVFGV
jgi:predicted DsbA family dithiol-disulfide isomerase